MIDLVTSLGDLAALAVVYLFLFNGPPRNANAPASRPGR